MSTLSNAIAYSASNRVIFLSKVAQTQVSGVFLHIEGFMQRRIEGN